MSRVNCEQTLPPVWDTTKSNVKLASNRFTVRRTGISATATLMNFMKGMIGPGCLSLPLAFRQAGLWAAFAMVFIFGILNNYCMLQIVHCSQYLSAIKGDMHLDYGGVAYEAFGNSFPILRPHKRKAKIFTNTMIIILQMGVLSVFYIFMALHVKEIVETIWPECQLRTSIYMFIVFVPLVLINYIRTLRVIAVFSWIANILMLTSFVIIFQDLLRSEHVTSTLPWITDFDSLATAAGAILYSFEGQAIVLPMENGLKHPEDMTGFTGVLSTGMSLVTIVYAASGFFGYVTYGTSVEGSITLNLPSSPLYTLVKVMLIVVIYVGFVIQEYVIIDMLWPVVKDNIVKLSICSSSKKCVVIGNYAFRSLLVTIAMIVALAVPRLETIIPLVGICSSMLLAFVIPATLDTVTFLPCLIHTKASKWRIARKVIANVLLITMGLFGLIAGLRTSILELINGA